MSPKETARPRGIKKRAPELVSHKRGEKPVDMEELEEKQAEIASARAMGVETKVAEGVVKRRQKSVEPLAEPEIELGLNEENNVIDLSAERDKVTKKERMKATVEVKEALRRTDMESTRCGSVGSGSGERVARRARASKR